MDPQQSRIATDFAQLQREYRNMEQNRRAYTEESQNIIRRQSKAIEKLKKDHDTLKAELAMESRHSATKSGSVARTRMGTLQDQGDLYTQKLASEAHNLEELDRAIELIKKKIMDQKRRMGGVNAAKENTMMIAKQVRILENRLDKALVKFNEALAHNKHLRETIDNLRRERVVFDNIYRKLEKELHEKKKHMANIIELSNQAYEARDQAQMEIAAMEQQDEKENADFDEQVAECNRLIDQEKKRKEKLMRDQKNESTHVRGDMSMEDEAKLKKKVNQGVWQMAKDKAGIHMAELKVQSYEEAFNRIKAATGITDIDQLVTTFISNEEQNFSLFNFVNEQNNDIEKLDEGIQALKEEESKYTQESGDDVNQHKQLLNDLEEKLQHAEMGAEKYEIKFSEVSKRISQVKLGIHNIFQKLECDSSAMSELLTDSSVTEANTMQFLGIIEQRTNEILQMWAAHCRKTGDSGLGRSTDAYGQPLGLSTPQALVNILGQGPVTPMGQDIIQINPPNLEDYSSDESSDESDSESRPLTHEELKIKTMKTLHKRAANHGKGDKGRGRSGGKGRGRMR